METKYQKVLHLRSKAVCVYLLYHGCQVQKPLSLTKHLNRAQSRFYRW